MQLINMGNHKAEVLIDTEEGPATDCVHIQPKGKVTLDEGHTPNKNWLAQYGTKILVRGDSTPVKAAAAISNPSSSASKSSSTSDEE